MSMHNYANSGLLLPAKKLLSLLTITPLERELGEKLINGDDADNESILEFFEKVLTEGSPWIPDHILWYDGDEPNDDLDAKTFYAAWDANDNPFYEKVLTPHGELMKSLGALPKHGQWVTWG